MNNLPFKYSVLLPLASRAKLPPDLHLRRFFDPSVYQAYLRQWSDKGFVIEFTGPHAARIIGASE